MQKRLEKLEAMYRLNQSILTLLDINVLLKQVLEIMHDTFGCDNSAVLLFEPKSEELYIAAAAGYKQDMIRRFRTSVGGHGVTGFVARNREPLFVPDTSADPRYVPGVEGARSEIAIPLLVNDQLYGVLDVESQKVYSFTEDDFKVLCVFASHIAMALHNALIFESERKRLSQLEVLNQIRNRLSARQEVDKLLQTVASSIVEFFNFHHVLIFLQDEQEQKLGVIASATLDPAAPHGCELPVDDNIVARAFSERRALMVPSRDGSPLAARVVAEAESEMCIPIAAGGTPIGAIYVGNVGSAGFDKKDLQVLEAISEQLSTVVTDAFAFQRESKRDRHIEVIHRIGLVPLQSFDFRKFTDDIASLIYDVYRFHHVSLYSFEKRSQQLELVAFAGEEMRDQQVGDKTGAGEGIVGHVARTGDYFLSNDTTAESRYKEAFLDTKSELTLPIRCDQEIVGVLNLESRKLNQFDKSDIDVFGKIADQVGYTIKNAELFRQKSSAHNLLLNLNSLSRELNATFDRKKILSAVVKQLPDLIGCRLCSVFFYHPQENTLELMVHNLPYLDEGDGMTVSVDDNVLMKKVISLNRSVYVADIETELSIPNKPQYATKSFLNILLRHQERIIGVLNLTDKHDRHVFSSEEFYLAHSFCEHLATAIVNAERYQKILELSITDGLTGLYVHRYFQEALDREIARSSRYNLPLSLLFLDLDDFKRFNAAYGHQVGDIVLREVAIALRTVTRAVDIACRYGGEEFTVILPSTNLEQARIIAERLRRKIASHAIVYGKKDLAVTASIGICQYRPGLSKADLIELADKAMQRAKASGKNVAVASETRSAGTIAP
ncbi:MAG: sensor domain-containing diguanylate cyclase [Acidobacteriota bacterium]